MKKGKRLIHNVFITVGLGTVIFVPMLILDNGLNETLKSVLIWVGASILYGLSFEVLMIKSKIKMPLHIIMCFIVTLIVRCLYSYFTNGTVNFGSIFVVTMPIFAVVYIILYLFMKYVGAWKADFGTHQEVK